jgi:hypothetical protein
LQKNLKQFRRQKKKKRKKSEKGKRPRGTFLAQSQNRPTAHPGYSRRGTLPAPLLTPIGGPHLTSPSSVRANPSPHGSPLRRRSHPPLLNPNPLPTPRPPLNTPAAPPSFPFAFPRNHLLAAEKSLTGVSSTCGRFHANPAPTGDAAPSLFL